MGTMIHAGNDVVSFLKSQHEQIKGSFVRVIDANAQRREREFRALRKLLAVHETAEEEVVHPAARRALARGEGDAIVAARLKEENAAKKALAELERLPVDSADFDHAIRALQSSVIAHAEAEEREEFARLGALLDEPMLVRMRKAAEIAEAVAPTHPHPGTESAAANLLVGPFASMIDRVRDALGGKT